MPLDPVEVEYCSVCSCPLEYCANAGCERVKLEKVRVRLEEQRRGGAERERLQGRRARRRGALGAFGGLFAGRRKGRATVASARVAR